MRIYHYNHTERSLLADITQEADSMSSILAVLGSAFQNSPPELERLERLEDQGVFVDLLAVARNSMQTGHDPLASRNGKACWLFRYKTVIFLLQAFRMMIQANLARLGSRAV